MQKMLRRTVAVGSKYALHMWTGFCLILSLLISTFLVLAMSGQDFTVVAWIVVIWSVAGIVVCGFALFQIQGKAEQIRADLKRILEIVKGQ